MILGRVQSVAFLVLDVCARESCLHKLGKRFWNDLILLAVIRKFSCRSCELVRISVCCAIETGFGRLGFCVCSFVQ